MACYTPCECASSACLMRHSLSRFPSLWGCPGRLRRRVPPHSGSPKDFSIPKALRGTKPPSAAYQSLWSNPLYSYIHVMLYSTCVWHLSLPHEAFPFAISFHLGVYDRLRRPVPPHSGNPEDLNVPKAFDPGPSGALRGGDRAAFGCLILHLHVSLESQNDFVAFRG